MIVIILLVTLAIALWKWWTYKCLAIGLMYFAELEHKWVIDDLEMEKILEFSIKKNINDLLK